MKFKSLVSIVLAAFLFLTGCQMGNNDANQDNRSPVDQTRGTQDGMNNDRLTQNVENDNRFPKTDDNRRSTDRTNNRYEVSDKASERIMTEIDEIGQAYVLTSDKNAYVAATLRDSDNRTDSKSDKSKNGKQSKDKTARTDDNRDNNRNARADDKTKDERPRTSDAANDRENMGRDMQNNSNQGDDLSDDVKKKITDIVKDTDDNIDNVYVSTSPDFFNLSNDFADDVENGHPIEGFFDQIGNMIERVFPQNKR
ncbi:MAG TPA: YhcN/YlaJ family sporulation lipoprotein [Pseudogracilibacillus sp.]|nr:YhcN/YlaJ family sporulation lipoprotein [Pseudogracilibacillus sp.]